MSAALLLPSLRATAAAPSRWFAAAAIHAQPGFDAPQKVPAPCSTETGPVYSLAFYRKHTEKMLRRYLYASMLVGRAPCILNEPLARGFVSSRPVSSFEDAVIFVLDVESCLKKLGPADRLILAKVVLQEYTLEEVALMFGIGRRALVIRLGQALDRLTETMLKARLLVVN